MIEAGKAYYIVNNSAYPINFLLKPAIVKQELEFLQSISDIQRDNNAYLFYSSNIRGAIDCIKKVENISNSIDKTNISIPVEYKQKLHMIVISSINQAIIKQSSFDFECLDFRYSLQSFFYKNPEIKTNNEFSVYKLIKEVCSMDDEEYVHIQFRRFFIGIVYFKAVITSTKGSYVGYCYKSKLDSINDQFTFKISDLKDKTIKIINSEYCDFVSFDGFNLSMPKEITEEKMLQPLFIDFKLEPIQ